MTRDDIIRMAREAGLCMANDEWPLMERFAALVAAAEREACIEIVDINGGSIEIVADIRAREQH